MSQGVIALIGIILIFAGAIILAIRSSYTDKLNLYDHVDSTNTEESDGRLQTFVKPVKVKYVKSFPSLERINGGIVGRKMFGSFARKNGPISSRASYNCFYILYCAVFSLGCFLLGTGPDGDMQGKVLSYGELEMEKDELLYVLSKGWSILSMIAGLMMIVGAAS